jgi:RNA polymerase sigma-70 factor (ECF subfamily)
MIDSADSTLIELAQNRDELAFAELVRRYQMAVWGRVCRILGRSPENEDAVQEVFLRTLTSLRKVKRDQPFGPWIMKITTNYCIDQLRRRKTRKDKLWSDLSDAEEVQASTKMASNPDWTVPPPEESGNYERIAHGLLDQLKPRRRTAFILREIENKSYEEVAHSLGITELTARVLVSRARADLHKGFLRLQADPGARR